MRFHIVTPEGRDIRIHGGWGYGNRYPRATVRVYRTAKSVCDKFTSWADEDGNPCQGFIHDTGVEELVRRQWVPVYEYPD